MRDTITIPPKGYPNQSVEDMKRVFVAIGYRIQYDPVTIADLANAFAAKMLGQQVEFKFKRRDVYEEKFAVMLKALVPAVVSGNTPLQKAAAFYSKLHNMGLIQKEPGEEQPQSDPLDEDEFQDQKDLSDYDNNVQEDYEDEPEFDTDEDEYAVMYIMTGKISVFMAGDKGGISEKYSRADPDEIVYHVNDEIIKVRDFFGTVAAEYANVRGHIPEVIDLTKQQKEYVENISILKHRPLIQAKVYKDQQRLRKMKSHREAAQIHSKAEMLNPLFGYKLLTKNLTVREKYSEGSQEVILLIDISSSMGNRFKKSWVRSILMHLYEEVKKGKSKLIVIPYEVNPFYGQAIRLEGPADVDKYMNWFPNFSHGVTNIARVLQDVMSGYELGLIGKRFPINKVHPHIIIAQDGDDSVPEDFTPSIPIHAFTFGQINNSVKSMCTRSRGSYELFYDAKKEKEIS